MDRDLVVIEAPGKLRTLHKVFAEIGLNADLVATIGHFLEGPTDLRDLAIGLREGEYHEYRRQPIRPDAFACLRDHLARCKGRILIATDADQEGEVIAADVAELASNMNLRNAVFRLRFSGLDADSVRAGLKLMGPADARTAAAGTARRLTDRIIGGCHSNFERGLPVGRVQSALLGLCTQDMPHAQVKLEMPARDGGKPFIGTMPVSGNNSPAELLAALRASPLSPADIAATEVRTVGQPLNFADALGALNAELGLSISRGAELLQELYEAGEISYPRTKSRGFTGAGAQAIERLAKTKGLLAFKKGLLQQVGETSEAHEAIRPLNEKLLRRLDLGKPFKLHASLAEAAIALIARKACEGGVGIQVDTPLLSDAPLWAQQCQWERISRKPMLPWASARKPDVVQLDQDSVLVQRMADAGVGRPSTWAGHAHKFLSRRYVDERFQLTEKGMEVLEHAPVALRDVVTSRAIEEIFDSGETDVANMVDAALSAAHAGDQNQLTQIVERLERIADEHEEDRPRMRPAF